MEGVEGKDGIQIEGGVGVRWRNGVWEPGDTKAGGVSNGVREDTEVSGEDGRDGMDSGHTDGRQTQRWGKEGGEVEGEAQVDTDPREGK